MILQELYVLADNQVSVGFSPDKYTDAIDALNNLSKKKGLLSSKVWGTLKEAVSSLSE